MDLIENDASKYFSIVACVIVAAVTPSSSRCLATTVIHMKIYKLKGEIYELIYNTNEGCMYKHPFRRDIRLTASMKSSSHQQR